MDRDFSSCLVDQLTGRPAIVGIELRDDVRVCREAHRGRVAHDLRDLDDGHALTQQEACAGVPQALGREVLASGFDRRTLEGLLPPALVRLAMPGVPVVLVARKDQAARVLGADQAPVLEVFS